MKRRTVLLLGVLPPLAAQARQPTPQTAQAFLDSLYAPYRTKGFNGQPYTEAGRFFEPILAAAMLRDYQRARRNGVPPTLNGDPFVDAQEWEIADLAIHVAPSGEQATATVEFTNLGRKKTLAIKLVQTPAGWRIADIAGAGGSLRALYKSR